MSRKPRPTVVENVNQERCTSCGDTTSGYLVVGVASLTFRLCKVCAMNLSSNLESGVDALNLKLERL